MKKKSARGEKLKKKGKGIVSEKSKKESKQRGNGERRRGKSSLRRNKHYRHSCSRKDKKDKRK